MIHNLGEKNSILNQYIAEIRSEEIQKDRLRFRRNLERIGEIFAYEISKTMNFNPENITTPLGNAEVPVLKNQPIAATILRAGLPMHQGIINIFDNADNAFVSAFRKYAKDGSFTIQFDYMSCPEIDGRNLIISDPMLATGASMVVTYQALLGYGNPLHTHIAAIIASSEGVEYLKQHLDFKNITLWLGAIDDELTAKSYIVPGLGDAGDLAFGSKV